jgi:hypothetical protein
MNEYQAKDRKATRILPDEVAPRVGLAPDTPRYHLAVDYLLDRGALKPAEWSIHAGEVCNSIEPKPPTPPAAALYARPRVVRGGWGLCTRRGLGDLSALTGVQESIPKSLYVVFHHL